MCYVKQLNTNDYIMNVGYPFPVSLFLLHIISLYMLDDCLMGNKIIQTPHIYVYILLCWEYLTIFINKVTA